MRIFRQSRRLAQIADIVFKIAYSLCILCPWSLASVLEDKNAPNTDAKHISDDVGLIFLRFARTFKLTSVLWASANFFVAGEAAASALAGFSTFLSKEFVVEIHVVAQHDLNAVMPQRPRNCGNQISIMLLRLRPTLLVFAFQATIVT